MQGDLFFTVYRWSLREGNPCWFVFWTNLDTYVGKQRTWLELEATLEKHEIQKKLQKWVRKVPSYNIFSIPTWESIGSCQLITAQLISQAAVKRSVEPEVADKFSAQGNTGNNWQCQSITLSSTAVVHFYKKIKKVLILLLSIGSNDFFKSTCQFPGR